MQIPARRATLGDGTNVTSTKSTHKSSRSPLRDAVAARRAYRPWTDGRVREMQRHPEMTSAALAELMGTTACAIRHARQRYGRYPKGTCCVCGERPVWGESRRARRMGLCKGCFLMEEARRVREGAESDRVRQARHRKGKR